MFIAYFGDIKDLLKSRGLGENLQIKFLRQQAFPAGPKMYEIITDAQLQLKLNT